MSARTQTKPVAASFTLGGKVALVTGGGDGLGRAIAIRLAAQGAKVGLIDINATRAAAAVDEIRAAGGEAFAQAGDATEAASADALAAEAERRWGPVDILVNNVGGGKAGHVWELSAEDWDAVIRINLRSMFVFTKRVLPSMMQRRRGRIVCLSSGAREGTPWQAHYAGASAYSAAKAGVHGFIRDVAMEVGEYGITINAVAPGPINTEKVGPMMRRLEEQDVLYAPSKLTPLRRMGEPVEIADAVVFLASDEASYITGVTLNVTGGR